MRLFRIILFAWTCIVSLLILRTGISTPFLLFPPILTAILLRNPPRLPAELLAFVALSAFTIVTGFSIGLYYVPSLLGMLIAIIMLNRTGLKSQ